MIKAVGDISIQSRGQLGINKYNKKRSWQQLGSLGRCPQIRREGASEKEE